MTVGFGFYNSVNGDRTYDAAKMSAIFDGLINDGVFQMVGNNFAPTASGGMNVTIGTGRAWFNSTWTHNDAPLVLTVLQAETTLNRIDTVVLEVNASLEVRANTIKVIKGTPAGSPVAPTLTETELIHQHPLCNIFVGANVTEISQNNITSLIGGTSCPFVKSIVQLLDYTSQVPFGGTTTNSGNNYVIASPTIPLLVAGMAICVKFNADSTGSPTLNWCGTGAKAIKQAGGSAAIVKNGGIYTLRYDGTNFILQGEGASGNATAPDLLSGKTASTDAGVITGTMPSKSAAIYTPGVSNQIIAANQFLAEAQTILGDPDLIAANIISGKNIFNVNGSAVIRKYATGVQYTDIMGALTVSGLAFQPISIHVYKFDTVTPFYEHKSYIPGAPYVGYYVAGTQQPAGGNVGYPGDWIINSSGFATAMSTIAQYTWVAFG